MRANRFNLQVLGAVLHRANTVICPDTVDQFYAMKRHILNRFGQQHGVVYQKITKYCWGDCYRECGDDCDRCEGSGIYDVQVTELQRWSIGRFEFLTPIRRLYGGEETEVQIQIYGKVRHKHTRLAGVCRVALFLAFAPRWFAFQTATLPSAGQFRFILRIANAIGAVPKSAVLFSSLEEAGVSHPTF